MFSAVLNQLTLISFCLFIIVLATLHQHLSESLVQGTAFVECAHMGSLCMAMQFVHRTQAPRRGPLRAKTQPVFPTKLLCTLVQGSLSPEEDSTICASSRLTLLESKYFSLLLLALILAPEEKLWENEANTQKKANTSDGERDSGWHPVLCCLLS